MTAMAPQPASSIPALPKATTYRSHTCGELRAADAGKEVRLCGQIDELPSQQELTLRDDYGTTLVKLGPAAAEELRQLKQKLTLESTLEVTGKVAARAAADATLPTGEVELVADTIRIHSPAKTPLIYDFRDPNLPTVERIRHRYMYLRNRAMHERLAFRSRATAEIRRSLRGNGFIEVETPLLANRWTAEAEEFFLAIRNRREIFALPGHRPIHPALLVAGGFDRAFEIARRFRRKTAYGPYQQPEYTVLDAVMTFIREDELHAAVDGLIAHVWRFATGAEPPKTTVLTHAEALERYGSDAPDLRFDSTIQDVTGRHKQLQIRAVHVPGGTAKVTEEIALELGAIAGAIATANTGWIALAADGDEKVRYFEAGVEGQAALEEGLSADILKSAGAKPGDLVFFAAAKDAFSASEAIGALRTQGGSLLKLADPKKHALVRVTQVPFYRYDRAKGWVLKGDPVTRPLEEDLGPDADVHRTRGQAADWVLDGVNIGGASMRHHDVGAFLQQLERFDFGAAGIDARFGQVIQAIRFGVPPYGRFAIGLDRWVARMLDLDRIDEVMPLPKMSDGNDPLARSPWPIDPDLVRGLLDV